MDEASQINPWATFCDEAHYEELGSILAQEGSPVPWAYFLPPIASAILFADHFWEAINAELGTLFDRAEEERLSPELSFKLARKIEQLASDRYRQGLIQRDVAWRADGSPIGAEISATSLRRLLDGLAAFLSELSEHGRVVIASL